MNVHNLHKSRNNQKACAGEGILEKKDPSDGDWRDDNA